MTDQSAPSFETKIAVVLRADLPMWQQLNMTAFLTSGVAAGAPEVIGENYTDADGTKYQPMFGQPVLVFEADAEQLARTLDRAIARNVMPAIFTTELFATGHDSANRAAVAEVPRTELNLAGLALHGPRRDVDKITKGLRLHG
ncbi:MAG TPA: DUF2000 domain-containing protein [Jatrophihabitans sp.]|nr:DUF2000 domain-containing protein [Jatrophihabitans sp.]